MLKLIRSLKQKSPEKALEALNKTTGLAWASIPVSLINKPGMRARAK
jgi:hypothetical protein